MDERREPTVLGMLGEQITTLERNLNRRLDTTEKTVGERFDRQDEQLRDIKAQTQRTNGRVTALERARDRTQGALSAYRWVPLVMSAGLTAGLTILTMALTGSIH